jgi:hypothetical protein
MKKSLLLLTVPAFVAATYLTSCSSSAEKVEIAKNDVLEAEKALEEANAEYLADIANYRNETKERIEANNRSVAEFNTRIETAKKDAKADYKKQIAELEQKNTDMKKRMDDYKADGKENWEIFKTEFHNDMIALNEAFKKLMGQK